MPRAIFTVVLLALMLMGCQKKEVCTGNWIRMVDSPEASRVVLNFSAKMRKEHRLTLEDSRMEYDWKIKKFYLEYASQELLTLCEARLLIVELVEEFLSRVNNNSVLGFQLENFPLTPDDLCVKINFESFYGIYNDQLYIGQVWLNHGCVRFYAFNRKVPEYDWDNHRFEPYFKSRELALLKKEADLPYSEDKLNPPKKPSTFIQDRYTPTMP